MFSDPAKNLKAVPIHEHDVVADLGAGTGHYSIEAGRLAHLGKVYAIEVQKDYLEKVRHLAQDARLNNVECLWGNIEKRGGTKLGDAVVDVVIASNVLFQVEDKVGFIEEVSRILKPNGKVLLVDWSDVSHFRSIAIIPKAQAREMFERKGFVFDREIDAGTHHYGMILVKNAK